MSKKQAIAFFEEISNNNQLAQEVEKVVEGNNSDEAKAKELISLAKKHNFNFTKEEAASAQEALKKPLSPEEMLEVSSGKLNLKSSLMAAAMLLGLGASGAALHSMEASAMKRSAPHQNNGKSGKIEPPNSTQNDFNELISRLPVLPSLAPQGQPTTTGNQQQTTPQLAEATGANNLTQNETPPSNDQGAAQSDSQQATRGTPHSRPRTTSGEERHAPRPPQEKKVQANVGHDKKAAERLKDVGVNDGQFLAAVRRLAGNGYLPNSAWPAVPQFEQTGDGTQNCRYCNAELTTGQSGRDPFCKNPKCIFPWIFRPASTKLQPSQRSVKPDSCTRWALLPALILDSRHERINSTGHSGPGTARRLAIETPAEAWAVWHLLDGHKDNWKPVEDMMKAHGVDKTKRDEVIRLLEESYDNLVLGNESFIDLGSEVQQLVAGHDDSWQNFIGAMVKRGYGSEEVKEAVTKMINSYYMLNENQPRDSGYTPSQAALDEIEAALQRFEDAMQQAEDARETAGRQAIEKLQRREELSLEEARAIAPMLKCGRCGKTGARAFEGGGRVYFQCADLKCRKGISNHPADLFAMLEKVAAENAPMEMANAGRNEQQLQMMQELPSVDETSHNTNQMNDNNNINNLNNINDPHEDNQQLNQMMNPNEFGFYFDAQGMNPFNLGQQMMMQHHDDFKNTFIEPYQLQTGNPNDFTFNTGLSHAPILRRLTVYQMDGSQQPVNVQMQNTDQMNGLPQNNHFAQNQQQILQRNTNQMNDQQQNTQFDQNQQNMTYQPGLNFDPTQILQQLATLQNATQPQRNLNQLPLDLDQQNASVGDDDNARLWDTWAPQ